MSLQTNEDILSLINQHNEMYQKRINEIDETQVSDNVSFNEDEKKVRDFRISSGRIYFI